MVSREENEFLTRVGPGTPMGELLRQYWLPVLIGDELQPDGDVLRIRLLCEDLIAFRDTSGEVGVLAANCPHRGADLFYGRNEEQGLRCPYHGWKLDVHGACVDMPSEPPDSTLKDKVRHKSYPCSERNSAIWVYMGRLPVPPPLPDLEWNLVPETNRFLAKRVQFCNWAQAIEGEIDQSHVSFLHAPGTQLERSTRNEMGPPGVDAWRKRDTHPRFHLHDVENGVVIGAQRDIDESSCYWRITQYLLPFHTMTGPYGDNPTRQSRAWIPIDDHTTLVFAANFHPLRPLTEAEVAKLRAGSGAGFVGEENFLPPTSEPFGAWRPKARRENDFFFKRELQRDKHFSGISEFWAQDAGMQEGMGRICDRSQEHLGTTDMAIIRVRRRLMQAAKAFLESATQPAGALDPKAYRLRGAAAVIPKGADWLKATEEVRTMIPGTNPDAPR